MGNHCTHCMACICRCPTEAIEYGKHSQGLPWYICKKTSNKKAVPYSDSLFLFSETELYHTAGFFQGLFLPRYMPDNNYFPR